MSLKTCPVCKSEKDASEFHKRAASKDGLSSKCKVCDKAKNAAWRAANCEKQKESKRKYWMANAEKAKEYCVAWQRGNPDKVKRITGKWRQGNRGKVNELGAKYRAMRFQATPLWADHEAIALLYEEAAFATEFFGIEFHVDHIVPLRSKLVCGLHVDCNLRVISGVENIKKSNRFWPDMPD